MRAVFLDLDGTLMDSRPGIIASLQAAFIEVGRPELAETDLTWMIGPRFQESFEKLGIKDPDAATEAYRHHYDGGKMYEAAAYDGVHDMVDALNETGYRVYLATAKPLVSAAKITAHFGLAEKMIRQFEPELDGTRSWKGDLLEYALNETGEVPEFSVMVGDRSHDVHAAQSVGMASVAVKWGYGGPEDWAEAHHVIERPVELLQAVQLLSEG